LEFIMESISGYGSAGAFFVTEASVAIPTGRIMTPADLFAHGYVAVASSWHEATEEPTALNQVGICGVQEVWYLAFQNLLSELGSVARSDYLRGGWEATELGGEDGDGYAALPFPGTRASDSYAHLTTGMVSTFLFAEFAPAISCLAEEWVGDMIMEVMAPVRNGYLWPAED
jgi:hypothetical protein